MTNAGIKNRAMAVKAQRENAVEIQREVRCCLWSVDGRDVLIGLRLRPAGSNDFSPSL
jgi:hypothetical protein